MDEFPTLDLDFVEETQETPEIQEETPELEETPAEVDDAAPAEGEEEQPQDGRKAPDDVRKALKALRDSSPENAKAAQVLRDSYGREQAYKAVFASVKDAQAAQTTIATIESFGGLEGVQQTISEIEEVDRLLAAGDPAALDKIIEVSGEGFAKIAPAMLDKLQASNPDAYAAAIRPHLVDAIGKSGLSDAFAAVMQAQQFAQTPGASPEFKAKWEKDAAEGLGKIQNYLQNLGKKPEGTQPPVQQNDAFVKREQELAAKEAAQFNTEVGTLANTKMNQSLQKAVAPYLKDLKLAPQARADYIQGVYDEITKLVKADKNYQTQKDALFKSKTKDAGKIASLMNAKFDSVVGQAAKVVRDRRYGTASARNTPPGAPSTPGAATGTGSVAKPILVKELPKPSDVDWTKTDDDMTIRGIRVLKSGKVIKLDR
jgi:hypothetical protein